VTREVVAQLPPRVPLAGFPARRMPQGQRLYRAHTSTLGAWWFGSDGHGRFDLTAPRGTCYLAGSALVALRERLGVVLGRSPVVPASLLEGAVVSRLALPEERSVADLQSGDTGAFGATRELETMVPYAVPQAWARGFDAVGLGGVAYGPRFTTGDATSYALFGPSGAADWPVDPRPAPAADVEGAPVALEPPRRWDVTVVRPPRTRPR
jgi:hypothetical protein